ncbi:hypothetical protein HMPREF1584_00739 [Gardnerella vaginalis JCP8481A]|nr:hypothetical protein HMPREF1585_00982 [Gardnerella vaginalis JCP8481B]EPI42963.1 hypothetical protein HMPREF1584_00739 [Gardnerella vaginalis JCP8481A]
MFSCLRARAKALSFCAHATAALLTPKRVALCCRCWIRQIAECPVTKVCRN